MNYKTAYDCFLYSTTVRVANIGLGTIAQSPVKGKKEIVVNLFNGDRCNTGLQYLSIPRALHD
ncbi:hypothetical protein [Calothrix sp. NIES-2098]|uniref:hypothetical protein n=1 Tax=Calothrix sp. NIES-2098 TaxID=1954171 RepID=UPI000B5E261C|nr:hypothetical protein NIES2098_21920 [Calothrix sp. NIES-2098]